MKETKQNEGQYKLNGSKRKEASVEKHSKSRIEIMVKARSQFKERR